MYFYFSHCYQKANKVADALADHGCDNSLCMNFEDVASLPATIHSCITLESQDIPYVRLS